MEIGDGMGNVSSTKWICQIPRLIIRFIFIKKKKTLLFTSSYECKTFFQEVKNKRPEHLQFRDALWSWFRLGLPWLVPCPVSLSWIKCMSLGMIDILFTLSWQIFFVFNTIPFRFQQKKLQQNSLHYYLQATNFLTVWHYQGRV